MSKVRVSLVRNSGQKRGQILSGIVTKPDFEDLAKKAGNKLKLKKKEKKHIRLFIFKDNGKNLIFFFRIFNPSCLTSK